MKSVNSSENFLVQKVKQQDELLATLSDQKSDLVREISWNFR